MLRKFVFLLITSLIVAGLITSCIPAGTTPAVTRPQPLSTANPDAFSTMVAGTVGALMTRTAEAVPSPTPTIPLPTATLTPTATQTPETSSVGTSLTQMQDGSISFVDNIAGIRLTIPTGWVSVRLNEAEYTQAWADAAYDPVLAHGMEAIQDLDPETFRLHAFNTQEGYVYEGEGSQINVVFSQDDPKTLEEIAETEEQSKFFDKYELISSEYKIRPDTLEIFIIEQQWQVTSSTEQRVMLYYKRAIFKVSSGTVAVDLYTPLQIKDDIVPGFDQMVEKLSVFTP
jgi:hypothetical protein